MKGGAGRIEVRALIMEKWGGEDLLKDKTTAHFDVEGGRNYTLVIEGGAGGIPPPPTSEWKLVIDSPSAGSRWEVSLGRTGDYGYRSIKTIKLTD